MKKQTKKYSTLKNSKLERKNKVMKNRIKN